jgi:16S rRNA (cytidine1402-2'-O)-methyltransferase
MGTLYLVATPIGNLEDITLRALRILREVRLIAAEDTRHTRKLLTHFGIATPTLSYHEHSPPARRDLIIEALAAGDVALVSDAGTPAISDPGQDLVQAAIAAGYPVVPIPGATAVISALIASGLPTDHFTFLGFLPRKVSERRALLEASRALPHTLILYEAPHRLRSCLDDLLAVLGDRQVALARELTKLHEEMLRGTLAEMRARYTGESEPRGEYVIVVAGASTATTTSEDIADELAPEEAVQAFLKELLASGASTREAAAAAAKATGIPKRDAYRMALDIAGRLNERTPNDS